ncbi:UvrD-helicase domain-containing protein, partial [Streptomyces sp. NPDC014983]|uniref:UvrD-helicase domain-containing protein n=1 Tax=Streptomyces sp. NPDC014983 TaxID=3364933 RepID=UPI0036FB2E7B
MSSSSSTGHLPHPEARRGSRGAYRLVRTPPPRPAPPLLDAAQRAVVDHRAGPLLVLAGPGTGKTTTLVESVAARIARGADPERILVLTFSRRAAVDLRDRMALCIGAARAPRATTFHSYSYALVRAHQDSGLFVEPLRLLSGPEQDVTVRELLAGQPELERLGLTHVRWPDELRACLTTRGFADEVRAVLARSRELGLAPGALDAFARRIGRPDWRAAAAFLAEYLDVLDLQGVIDYAELVHRAVLLARRPEVAAALAARYDAVYVDEYQDTDPAQVRLLGALAGGGRTLVALGDPDQSIYTFRGADVNGILDFPEAFPRSDGSPAPVQVLRTNRRSGATLLAATRLITQRMPLPRLPADKVRAHREPAAARDGGRVEVYTYPTQGTETDNIADILRRAHLEDGLPWREMAVLVRAGARSLPTLRRALTAAGVPLDIDGDDLPLRHEPAVAPLLTALRAVATAEARGRDGETRRPGPEERRTADTRPAGPEPEQAGTGEGAEAGERRGTDEGSGTGGPAEPEARPEPGERSAAGEHPEPAGEDREAAGEHPEPAGEDPEPAGEDPEPAGEHPESAGEDRESAGEHPEPAGEDPEPAGEDPEPAGEDRESAGEDRESAGEDRESAGEDRESAGE